jgi:hypothetical protein
LIPNLSDSPYTSQTSTDLALLIHANSIPSTSCSSEHKTSFGKHKNTTVNDATMPASTLQNPTVVVDANSTKKKKGKAPRTDSPAPSASEALEKPVSVSGDDASESPYIREMSKCVAGAQNLWL